MNHEPLGKHAELIRGITFKPTDKCQVGDDDSVVCMRTKNVQIALDESDLIAVPRSLVTNDKKMIRLGDILVSSANSWNLVGKCCIVPELAYAATAGGFISILRPTNGKLDASYLYRWFSSQRVQATVRSLGNQTTNISNLDHKRTLTRIIHRALALRASLWHNCVCLRHITHTKEATDGCAGC
jgi:type I restriction enzyme S subunit